MMGGILSAEQAKEFQEIMEWEQYEEDENIPDEVKLTLMDNGHGQHSPEGGDARVKYYFCVFFFCFISESLTKNAYYQRNKI